MDWHNKITESIQRLARFAFSVSDGRLITDYKELERVASFVITDVNEILLDAVHYSYTEGRKDGKEAESNGEVEFPAEVYKFRSERIYRQWEKIKGSITKRKI